MPTQAPMAPKVFVAFKKAMGVSDEEATEAASEVGEVQVGVREVHWKVSNILWIVSLILAALLAGFGWLIILVLQMIRMIGVSE